ncbi:Pectinesterase QRT1 [Camellia lanceoleosa]|uniref:Pectinesterase QRT1 n=1 Tax=Camellia lanceoleosa TaxID=1840588 RepID=A0ACC0H5Z1_9ERIC|nr:Pectinesterase QRT1 [Camellia lanceoleosa]
MGSLVAGFLVLFLGSIEVGSGKSQAYTMNYITWEDMKVDLQKERLDLNEEQNRSRVIVVDQNGKGDSVTVQGAVDMVPLLNSQRVKVYIHPGIYREKVFVPNSKPYISFIGDEKRTSETIITWNDKASDKDNNGRQLGTSRSASVTIESDFFCATSITFENSVAAVPKAYGMQAVALRLAADKAMLYKVRVLGTQDTLLDDYGSHYFYQCYIQGSVDFIFGKSRSLYQDCVLHSTAERFGAIAAHHRDSQYDDTGFSFVNCIINGSGIVYLGRAWGNYSRVIYSYCDIDNIITSSGWSDRNQPSRQKTVMFGEYHCKGRGADRRNRVPWSKSLNYEERNSSGQQSVSFIVFPGSEIPKWFSHQTKGSSISFELPPRWYNSRFLGIILAAVVIKDKSMCHKCFSFKMTFKRRGTQTIIGKCYTPHLHFQLANSGNVRVIYFPCTDFLGLMEDHMEQLNEGGIQFQVCLVLVSHTCLEKVGFGRDIVAGYDANKIACLVHEPEREHVVDVEKFGVHLLYKKADEAALIIYRPEDNMGVGVFHGDLDRSVEVANASASASASATTSKRKRDDNNDYDAAVAGPSGSGGFDDQEEENHLNSKRLRTK